MLPQQEFGWEQLADAPVARQEVAAAAADDKRVYVAGGLASGGATARVDYYDPGINRWGSAPDLPIALHHAMAVSLDDHLVVLGGFTAGNAASDRVFRLRFGAWEELPAMPRARAAGGAAVARGRIVVAGGQAGGALIGETDVFDGKRWRAGARIPTPRDHLGVASDGVFVYAVDGRRLSINSSIARLERYDVRRDRWKRLPGPAVARGGIGVGVAGGDLIVLGGEGPKGVYPQVERYDLDAGIWDRERDPMPVPRHGIAAVAIAQTIYVAVGGARAGGDAPSTRLEAFRLASTLAML